MRILVYIFCLFSFISKAQGSFEDTLRQARIHYNKGEFNKAYRFYLSAKNLGANETNIKKELAQSAYKAEKYDEADDYYGQLASNAKKDGEKGDDYFNQGNARMKQENYAGAIESYKQALRLNPNDDEARYNLSEAIRKLKAQNNSSKQNPSDPKDPTGENQDKQKSNGEEDPKGKLEENSIERTLDKLMRKEKETKQEINKSFNSTSSSSEKDW